MLWLSILWFTGCTGTSDPPLRRSGDRPTAFVDPGIDTTGAGPLVQLWRTPGRYALTPTVLPAGFTPDERFPIALDPTPTKVRKSTKLYAGRTPFKQEVEEEGRVSAPPGMELFVGDQKLDYHPNLLGESWRISGDELVVAWKGDVAPEVSISYPVVATEVRRRDFATAGLEPAAFVLHEVTLDARTRHGLMLPAPSSAEWDLELPQGSATFEGWLAISPLQLRTLASDGAYAVLSVVSGGETTEVARQFTKANDAFEPWRVDLSAWAGKKVTLRLATDPYTTPDFDYVFVGSPTVWGPPTGPIRRVVVIGLDTTRPDHFGFNGYARDPTPELDAVARTSLVFDHTWAPAPRTRPSFRTAFTGRRPLDAVGAKNMAAVFQEHGFVTSGIVANVHLQPRFEFDEGFDDWWYDGQAKAVTQVDRAIAFFDHYPDRDSFLFLHIMDPHLFYSAPGRMRDQYVEDPDPDLPDIFNRWEVYGWMKSGRLDERRKKHIVARYDAELASTSLQLGRLFERLDALEGRSLVVLHSDHGEEFWEHGGFEHNHTVYDETTRVLLWFRSGPGQTEGQRISTPVTLADIAPTLFELAKFEDVPPTDGRSLVPLMLGGDPGTGWEDREIGVAHLRYGTERWGVVHRGHKYVLHTASGEEELYDLAADPGETVNLAPKTVLVPYREALARAHSLEIGRGWRIAVDLHEQVGLPFHIVLPQPAVSVGIVDPEATIENPANTAWGEPPARVPADIGEVVLSEDRTTLTFTPGPHPQKGLLYVRFDADVDPTTTSIVRGDNPLVTLAAKGKLGWRAGRDLVEISPGTIVTPPVGEGPRIRAMMGEGFDLAAQHQMLCDLGYLKCDGDDTPGTGSDEH